MDGFGKGRTRGQVAARVGIAAALLPLLFGALAGGSPDEAPPLDAALEPGYSRGDVAAVAERLAVMAEASPDDAELRAWYARALLSLEDGRAALIQAERAMALDPLSANAVFAKSQALLAASRGPEALALAVSAVRDRDLRHGPGTRAALIYSATAMFMAGGDYAAAESLLLGANPALADLAGRPPPPSVEDIGGPWHGIQALAAIYAATGRESGARALSARLAPVTEDWLRAQDGGRLSGAMLWNLAATGVGRIDEASAIGYLRRAVDAGFLLDWHYNYAQHPALRPLQEDPRYAALLRQIRQEMSRQRARPD